MSKYWLGKHLSDEHKAKLSAVKKGKVGHLKGKHLSEEWRDNIKKHHADFSGENHPQYGTHLSEETRKKISISNIGNKKWLSKHHNEKTRIKMSNSAKLRPITLGFTGKHHTPEVWRKINSSRRFKETKIEVVSQESLAKRGYTFLCNVHIENRLVPDQILPDYKIAIFEDGCYWHGCSDCGYENNERISKKTGKITKFKDRRFRELELDKTLKSLGWTVFRFWEHEIKNNPDIVGESIEKSFIPNTYLLRELQ